MTLDKFKDFFKNLQGMEDKIYNITKKTKTIK